MKNFILGFVLAAVVFTGGYFAYTHWSGKAASTAVSKVMYHCPMHPTYISDQPGDCPICGMKLVPIAPSTGSNAGAPDSSPPHGAASSPSVPGYVPVTIPPERIQTLGITVAEASRVELDQSFRTFGRIAYDETMVHHVHTRFEGYIEHLFVNYTGQYVKAGQSLFSVYSPELYATQNEYLLALRAREQREQSGSKAGISGETIDLVGAARERLMLWGIGETELNELDRTRQASREIVISSPVSGYVTARVAVHGLKVSPADNLYDIVDLSTVWVLADVYEVNLSFVRVGQPAIMTLDYKPGKIWRGRVTFIDPTVDPATRTVKARLEFSNRDGELKPEMYAHIVFGGARATGIAVPDSAVIATGERNIVFVAKGNGIFEPREVILGARVRNMYEIKQGISEGEKVVTGASFLLDSESKLKAAVAAGS
jgi:membrane fusion protein, copper/silver efflux system